MQLENSQTYQYLSAVERSQNIRSLVSPEAASGANIGRSDYESGNQVSLSEDAKRLSESESVYTLKTAGGDRDVDLDSYFEPKTNATGDLFDLDSLLLPSSENLLALQDHLSGILPGFLQRHDIPEMPSEIRYDGAGNPVFPADYAYADQFRQALKEEPAVAREMSTLNALSSHVAALKALEPFHEAYEQAGSQAEIDAVLEQFSHLLGENRRYPRWPSALQMRAG